MELNFERLKIQKWIVPTDRVQIDEKNEVICLVTMFTQEDLSVAIECFAQAVINFLLSSAKNTKKSHVLHFNNYNSESKHDFYHFLNIFTPFFSFNLWALYVGLSHLCIPRTSKFHFAYVLVCKIHIYLPMMTLWSLLT